MVTDAGDPLLLEHNVRFGDPECEALMELVDGDLAALLASAAAGRLEQGSVRIAADRSAAVVVLAAAGYPAGPRRGDRISGIDAADAIDGVRVHHAGTEVEGGALVTAGGRVLAVTARGPSLAEARAAAYRAAELVVFDGKHFRRDIGATS
jgi:phosphoribosylamine---glycine ligase